MPYARLIPCLDVAHGRVVKGRRFLDLRDVGDPVVLGEAYSALGADELVFLDVRATLDGSPMLVDLVGRVADRLTIPFTVGGGIRSLDQAAALVGAGADKIVVNSAAIARPAFIGELASEFGAQAVVVAIDSAGGRVWSEAATRRTELRTVDWALEAHDRGAGEILLTSIDADGTRTGYDIGTTRSVADVVAAPVIASGGAGQPAHIAHVLEIAQAALLASLVHEDPQRLRSIRAILHASGVALRDVA